MDLDRIDIITLREDLKKHFLDIAFNISPAAFLLYEEIDDLTDIEVCQKAVNEGFNLDNYTVKRY